MKMAYKEEGKWWVSPANYLPEVTKNYHFPEHIEILDTTLRDGEQEPGIIFTKEDKVAIAKRLDAAGVHRIEAGCPMTSEEDAAAIKEICALGLKAKIYCFVRGVMSDMDVAKACGVDGVDFGLSIPTTIAALQAGAFCAHVTVNGIGERAGSCPLEPLVMSLQCLYGQDTGIKYDELLGLSHEVAARSGKPVPPTKAIVGTRLFGWETGLPTGYWLKSREMNHLILLPYHFSMTGQPAPHIYIGKKSGAANVTLVNERLGLAQIEDKDKVKELLHKVKELSIQVKRDLTDEEYTKLYHEVV